MFKLLENNSHLVLQWDDDDGGRRRDLAVMKKAASLNWEIQGKEGRKRKGVLKRNLYPVEGNFQFIEMIFNKYEEAIEKGEEIEQLEEEWEVSRY